eukprot:gene14862-16406_t
MDFINNFEENMKKLVMKIPSVKRTVNFIYSIPTHMDFEGQKKAEVLYQVIIALFGVIAMRAAPFSVLRHVSCAAANFQMTEWASRLRATTRQCPQCVASMPISLKKCKNCGVSLAKQKNINYEELSHKYSATSMSYLKDKIKTRADILFSKGCEVLVIGFNSNQERGSLWSYSPHGSIGESFLKEEAGQYVVKLFKQCIEKKNASASIPAASTTQT